MQWKEQGQRHGMHLLSITKFNEAKKSAANGALE